jgi:hypothetical protein
MGCLPISFVNYLALADLSVFSQDDLVRLIARQKEFIQQHHIMADLPNKGAAARRQYFAMCAVRDGRPIPPCLAAKENTPLQNSVAQSTVGNSAAQVSDQKLDSIISKFSAMGIATSETSTSKLTTPAAFSRFVLKFVATNDPCHISKYVLIDSYSPLA